MEGRRRVDASLPARRGFSVVDDRTRADDDAVTGEVRPPAEVEVVAEKREGSVESAERVPGIAPHQHAGRAHREHPAHAIVLAMVEFALLEARLPASAAIDGDADFEQHPPIVPTPQLGADDRG